MRIAKSDFSDWFQVKIFLELAVITSFSSCKNMCLFSCKIMQFSSARKMPIEKCLSSVNNDMELREHGKWQKQKKCLQPDSKVKLTQSKWVRWTCPFPSVFDSKRIIIRAQLKKACQINTEFGDRFFPSFSYSCQEEHSTQRRYAFALFCVCALV